MRIDELIQKLVLIRIQHGNVEVAKRFMKKNHYETHKREIVFQDIEPKFGLIRTIVTVPHDIYRHRETGEPFMVQMKVDDESKERFTYELNQIISL